MGRLLHAVRQPPSACRPPCHTFLIRLLGEVGTADSCTAEQVGLEAQDAAMGLQQQLLALAQACHAECSALMRAATRTFWQQPELAKAEPSAVSALWPCLPVAKTGFQLKPVLGPFNWQWILLCRLPLLLLLLLP